jgi:hypothetical protein
VIPLYQFVELAAHRTTLRGVVLTPIYHRAGAENWWVERLAAAIVVSVLSVSRRHRHALLATA